MADDPLRAAMQDRCNEIRQKIAARKGKPGMSENIETMQTALNEMERLLAIQPEGEE